MGDPVIRLDSVGKLYRLGSQLRVQASLSEALGRTFGGLLQQSRSNDDQFWALKDISLKIDAGQVVGLIGRNGAGKSTLLKILSRITHPTEGRAELRGRTVSLLDVGVGFHPELSGRDNIYLNGAILGMRKREIQRKFDEIVAFAEVDKFIDTPVKRYSTGMYVRLAFAVAAHLEPDILLVDEVLAVGDMIFQKKCMGKMEDVAKSGRTVLFVSHNLAAIKELCTRGIVLRDGRILADEKVDKAVETYTATASREDGVSRKWGQPPPGKKVWPVSVDMRDDNGQIVTDFHFDQAMTVDMVFRVYEPLSFQVAFGPVNSRYIKLFTAEAYLDPRHYQPGTYRFSCRLPPSLLFPDLYRLVVDVHRSRREWFFSDHHALSWVVEETGSNLARYSDQSLGVICLNPDWEISKVD